MRELSLLSIAVAVLAFAGAAPRTKPTAKKIVIYRDVKPILVGVCAQCHKGAKPPHGLDLTTFARTMKGDRAGRVVLPGQPGKSRLATVLHGKPQLMPPGGELSKPQIAKIEAWIKDGAKEK